MLLSEGYKALSVRKIASLCNMATGTFYLYFASKDMLVATVVARTWATTLKEMSEKALDAGNFKKGMAEIYLSVRAFSDRYRRVFSEYSGSVGSHDTLLSRHAMLRRQISEIISDLADVTGQQRLAGHSDVLAECLLAVLNQPDMDEYTLTSFMELIVNNQQEEHI